MNRVYRILKDPKTQPDSFFILPTLFLLS